MRTEEKNNSIGGDSSRKQLEWSEQQVTPDRIEPDHQHHLGLNQITVVRMMMDRSTHHPCPSRWRHRILEQIRAIYQVLGRGKISCRKLGSPASTGEGKWNSVLLKLSRHRPLSTFSPRNCSFHRVQKYALLVGGFNHYEDGREKTATAKRTAPRTRTKESEGRSDSDRTAFLHEGKFRGNIFRSSS